MKLNVFKTIILVILISLMAVSCADDFPYRIDDIPEGDGTLSATVTFTPITASNLGATRTVGTAIQNIESLCVLVYDKEKNLVKKYEQSDLVDYVAKNYNEDGAYEVDQNKDYDHDVEGAHTDETKSARASFKLKDLPYGQYYIFAVANMGDLSDPKYADAIKTVDGLQHIRLTWDKDKIENNNQMFGYFTPDNDMESGGFIYDKPLTFTGKETNLKIHAWLKRAASKVTVAFDPSGLNQGVTIYVRNVTIRDIPKTCLLGAENTPVLTEGQTADDILWNHLSSYDDPNYKTPTDAVVNSRLWYDSKGVITTGEETGSNENDGLRLDNSIRGSWPEGAHDTDAPSLFFYENNQNPYLINADPNYKNNQDYNKRPQTEGDDEVGSTIHKPENIKDKDKINDFKDRVPLGTYVEVEAFYISSNPANPGKGTIKYRFMLGKDTSFDYDAQRNYHYKLTLGFKGWANNPDWHIDYVMSSPDIEVQSVFRVSYLYQQKSELPIKIVGNVKWLTVTITENNWAPYDPDPQTNQTLTYGGVNYLVPKQTVSTTAVSPYSQNEWDRYEFQWNEAAFRNPVYLNPGENEAYHNSYVPVGAERPEFGFLALHLPNRNTTLVETEFSLDANRELIAKWNQYLEGERRFDGSDFKDFGKHDDSYGDRAKSDFTASVDDAYTVDPVYNDYGVAIENQRILQLPVWTRTKTLINTSGFSGNNPYEAFERKAMLHIKGIFIDHDENGDEIEVPIDRDVEVYQVKRITNPKGVWRSHEKSNSFNVTLLEAINSNALSNFKPFVSQGEWTAFVDEDTNAGAGFTIRPNGKTNGYMENGVIHGNTGSEIHFAINFNQTVTEKESKCAVIKVLYHGNQCMHKILVRKGYNEPLRMGKKNIKWSSFSLYQASKTGQLTADGDTIFDAVLTKNPLMLGSMFRRGRLQQGIFVWNNQQSALGPLIAPGASATYVVGLPKQGATIKPGLKEEEWRNQWQTMTWAQIGFVNTYSQTSKRETNMGLFYALDDNGNHTTENNIPIKYRVPTYSDFQDLTDNSEFGFGVFYGSEATQAQEESQFAYGLIDPYNLGLFNDPNGMRAVVAYDKTSGNQILFPIGRFGIGVRRMYNTPSAEYNGNLHYSDVYSPLTNALYAGNLFRPIPYNLPSVSGCIYWVDKWENVRDNPTGNTAGAIRGRACLGWDMNYFNFDFNSYTANNWQDACPIKFVIDE